MGKMEKLIERLKSLSMDFTWDELTRLLRFLEFQEIQGRGSRVKFFNKEKNSWIHVHKPHPSNILKHYALKKIVNRLLDTQLI
jgi:predicted RNA binding protein YcfA (HicA-like mRNA interferase family)